MAFLSMSNFLLAFWFLSMKQNSFELGALVSSEQSFRKQVGIAHGVPRMYLSIFICYQLGLHFWISLQEESELSTNWIVHALSVPSALCQDEESRLIFALDIVAGTWAYCRTLFLLVFEDVQTHTAAQIEIELTGEFSYWD